MDNNINDKDFSSLPTENQKESSSEEEIGKVKESASILSILTLISGIISLPTVFCCGLGFYVFSPAAIIMGIIELVNIKNGKSPKKGKMLVIIGIVCAIVGPLLYVIIIVIFGVGGSLLEKYQV